MFTRIGITRRLTAAAFAIISCTVSSHVAQAGLFGSDSPTHKLAEAQYLAEGPGRIMRARQLIEEARTECEKAGDKSCLAEVNRLYGLLERGGATTDIILMRGGINAHKSTPEELDRSDVYFNKALVIATEAQEFDAIVNINYLLAINQQARGMPLKSCRYFDAALAAAKEAQRLHPDRKMDIAPYHTADEAFTQMKKDAGCPVAPAG